jgi:hypothetical protein
MKKYCIIALGIFFFYSCTDNNIKTSTPIEVNKNGVDSFFPVTSFIKGQIMTLDSIPITPLQLTITKEKTDSIWLPKNKLAQIFIPFLIPAISETNLTDFFKETKFNDQTLNAITFTYDPYKKIPDSISLRHWDVYINPETGSVIKVYVVKQLRESNQLITQQLTWQTNKMAKISTILNKQDGEMELLKEVIIKWDFSKE